MGRRHHQKQARRPACTSLMFSAFGGKAENECSGRCVRPVSPVFGLGFAVVLLLLEEVTWGFELNFPKPKI